VQPLDGRVLGVGGLALHLALKFGRDLAQLVVRQAGLLFVQARSAALHPLLRAHISNVYTVNVSSIGGAQQRRNP
jgi:hypothetical protein